MNERSQDLPWVTVPAGMPVCLVPLSLRGSQAWSEIILHCLISFCFSAEILGRVKDLSLFLLF